eukprot:CAMPEP_0194443528 /NCGR_PEP_ID=MMETSP0176-20130528/126761_1 /TAXON_ID=216777 /ORGANISM="Proboscia alata, Strain PI-D3" /LENGTH=307 /DNA_ID=CAMNT_0039269797 /DNA_START=376 /DNA_END=1301 /DNA_ORIENTATION=-
MKRENGALINIKMSHDGKTAAHPFETALHSSDADLSLLQSSSLVGSSRGIQVGISEGQKAAVASTQHDDREECDTIQYGHIPHEPEAWNERTVQRWTSKHRTTGDLLLTHLKPAFHEIGLLKRLPLNATNAPLIGAAVQIQSIPFAVRGRVCGLGTIGVSNERQPNQPEMNGEQTAEGYSWTQTNDEIEIWVPISATLKPIVTFRQMTLKVSVNNVRWRIVETVAAERNQRAMDLAQRCRYNPHPLLYGDVFVGWVQYQPTIGDVDVRVEEVENGGEWIERATVQNIEYQADTIGVSNERQPNQPEM